MLVANIKIEKLVTSIVLAFAIADPFPHPSFSRMINSETLSNMTGVITRSTD